MMIRLPLESKDELVSVARDVFSRKRRFLKFNLDDALRGEPVTNGLGNIVRVERVRGFMRNRAKGKTLVAIAPDTEAIQSFNYDDGSNDSDRYYYHLFMIPKSA